MSVAEIAQEAVLSSATTQTAIDELTSIGFILKGLDGAYEVAKFQEKTQADPAAAARKRRQRDRDKGIGLERDGHAAGHVTEEEEEEDKESGASRTRSICDCQSTTLDGRNAMTAEEIVDPHFLATFARATKPSTVDKIRPKWLGWVRLWLDAGYSPANIWLACAVAHADAKHSLILQSGPMWAALKRIRPDIDRKGLKPAEKPRRVDLDKVR